MTLRRRLTLLAVVIVGVTVLIASVVVYAAMRGELRAQVDSQLAEQADLVRGGDFRPGPGGGFEPGRRFPAPPPGRGGSADYLQIVAASGAVLAGNRTRAELPVEARDLAVASGLGERIYTDREVEGAHVRVLTAPAERLGLAVQLGRSLEGVDSVLARMRVVLVMLVLGATAAAVAAGRLLTRPVLAPVAHLTAAAEHIEATGDLDRRVPVAGDDELGRLGARFNAMLERLSASVAAQRQLVADASHELRTPVTSLRTNAEVLRESANGDQQQRALLDDVVMQSEELSELVGDIIELARGDEREQSREDVALHDLVAEAVERARRHSPSLDFDTSLEPCAVEGDPGRIARAVNNLLDNAAKYSEPGGKVEVALRGGELAVRDHGAGIPEPELGRVFERFYRGSGARERHGSGLGLAIVRQVAESHGGSATIENAPGGGTIARLRLPFFNSSSVALTERCDATGGMSAVTNHTEGDR